MALPQLKIPYYNKDYASIKASLLSVIKNTDSLKDVWTDYSDSDFGMVILQLFTAIADLTSFNIDNQAAETFLDTARKRINVYRLAKMLGYSMGAKVAATTNISITFPDALNHNFSIPIGTKFKTSGTSSRVFTTSEVFIIPSSPSELRSCVFKSYVDSGETKITDVGLSGVSIPKNTYNGIIYCKYQNVGGKNKIALYTSPNRTGDLDTSTTDVYKIGYGEVPSGIYIIPITGVNNSGVSGNIYIGSSNFPTSITSTERIEIQGPLVFEGELFTEYFVSTGLPNQRFNTQKAMQKIPSSSIITRQVLVNSVAWTEVEDLFFEQQNYFTVETIEYDYSTIIFGDGDSGNIPPEGANISVTYVQGNGASGHVGANKITGILTTLSDSGNSVISNCINIYPTNNAQDEESIGVVKRKAIEYYKTRSRAVHETDYEYLISLYKEDNKYNPELVQVIKNESEPDLINEVEIFVLSKDPDSGRPRLVDIDLTVNGGLWGYITPIKTIPEGIRKSSDGQDGFQDGTIDTATGKIYFSLYKIPGYDKEVIREAVRTAIINYYHDLTFQDPILLFNLSRKVLEIEGVQSVQFYSDLDRETSITDNISIEGWANRGKILVLPEDFYIVGEKDFIKIIGD